MGYWVGWRPRHDLSPYSLHGSYLVLRHSHVSDGATSVHGAHVRCLAPFGVQRLCGTILALGRSGGPGKKPLYPRAQVKQVQMHKLTNLLCWEG